ncbi:DUF892 family protein, partial [Klebsiella pneumoniae]|uniref:DUF892 family protein n=1 Tax=Klebsiella pneumoniae TaxID=573 RepID=UPI002931E87B
HISRSALKDAMSRVAALGQTIGIMLPGDEVIKVIITAYVFAHNEPQLRTRLEQHLYETRRQLSALQDIIARNHISRSALKDAM